MRPFTSTGVLSIRTLRAVASQSISTQLGKSRGIVPRSDEWYKWDYVSPAELTADKKYEAQVALDQYKAGWITGRQACARLGLWYDDVVSRRETETRELIDAAKRIAAETGTPFETALVLLRDTGAYSSVTNSAAAMTEQTQPTE